VQNKDKLKLSLIGSRPRAFQPTKDEANTLPTPKELGLPVLKLQMYGFENETRRLPRNVSCIEFISG